jgi:peptidoglycan/xylan/chitin deacetylase (PgdA/CDA1 family)
MNYARRARHVLKWLLCEVLNLLGVIFLLEASRKDGVRILVYHRVSPFRIDDGMTISQMAFDAQLRYLGKHYSVVSLDEVAAMLRGECPTRSGVIALTFDDGYRDNYTQAWPILARYSMPATIFVTVGPLEGEVSLWTEEIRAALGASSSQTLDLESMGWGSWPLTTDAEKLDCLHAVKQRLKAVPDAERQRALREIIQRLCPQRKVGEQGPMLTWDMVREMSKGGFTIGAHTMSHKILTQIAPEEVDWEIRESKHRIEQRLGEPSRHFAYPNGTRADWDSQTQEAVKQAGFETACTTIRGTNPAKQDLYALRRLEITDAGCTDPRGRFSAAMFAAQLAGVFGGREWQRE